MRVYVFYAAVCLLGTNNWIDIQFTRRQRGYYTTAVTKEKITNNNYIVMLITNII